MDVKQGIMSGERRIRVYDRTRARKDRVVWSHLGSCSRSMRLLLTMGLIERSDECQMSFSSDGCPGVDRAVGVAGTVEWNQI